MWPFNRKKALAEVSSTGSWWPLIKEPFTGAWQRNQEEVRGSVLTYPTLYACIARIAQDIGKLPFALKNLDSDGIWTTVTNSAYTPLLKKPNHYQTAQQFRESWMISKLTQGNTYALKQRDSRGVVKHLYVLDPWRVRPLVSDNGDVFYELLGKNWYNLPPLPEGIANNNGNVIVPSREIIHDRCITLHNQLIGVPPLAAAHWPAIKNLKILKNATEFFNNQGQPGGILTGPAGMTNDEASRITTWWQSNFNTAEKRGRIAAIGADLKFTPFAFNSVDSQLVEQLRYSDEQVCQAFGIPPFVIGLGTIPAGMKADDMANMYYNFALQAHIESMEYLLDEGLAVNSPLGIELDLSLLLRMDPQKQALVEKELVAASIETPNEARKKFNLASLTGGDTVYMQQQNYSLEALSLRDSQDPFGSSASAPSQEEDEVTEEQGQRLIVALEEKFAEAQ